MIRVSPQSIIGVLLVLALLSVGGCANEIVPSGLAGPSEKPPLTSPFPAPEMSSLPAPSTAPYPGIAWSMGGRSVPTNELSMIAGPEACGFGLLTLLTMGKTLGQEFQDE